VTLSLMDSPYIVRVQVAPDIKNGLITVQLRLRNVSGTRIRFPVKLSVREWKRRFRVCGGIFCWPGDDCEMAGADGLVTVWA